MSRTIQGQVKNRFTPISNHDYISRCPWWAALSQLGPFTGAFFCIYLPADHNKHLSLYLFAGVPESTIPLLHGAALAARYILKVVVSFLYP
jgi:hypothetical protein